MKPDLLAAAGDPGATRPLLPDWPAARQDLQLDLLLTALSDGDQYLAGVASAILATGLETPAQIRYRQDVLADCLRDPGPVRALYDLAAEADRADHGDSLITASAGYTLERARHDLDELTGVLRGLHVLAAAQPDRYQSAGLRGLLTMLTTELADDYLTEVKGHQRQLMFGNGMLMTAGLGPAGKGTGYVLHADAPGARRRRGLRPGGRGPMGHVLMVPDRDVSGRQALSALRDQGERQVAGVIAMACASIRQFLAALRRELAFYVGALNLYRALSRNGLPLCLPEPWPASQPGWSARGLCDAALALTWSGPIAGNDIDATDETFLVVTGASQGGKSTFLRSVGLAQLMMQSGLFVAAESFASAVCTGILTHGRRPEDVTMTSGKLAEELGRMSGIVDTIRPGGLLLANDSFGSTSEPEAARIAAGIFRAAIDCGVRIVLVTHNHTLAGNFAAQQRAGTLFLRASPRPDGSRTFRLAPGAPQPTSHARDIYEQVFGERLESEDR